MKFVLIKWGSGDPNFYPIGILLKPFTLIQIGTFVDRKEPKIDFYHDHRNVRKEYREYYDVTNSQKQEIEKRFYKDKDIKRLVILRIFDAKKPRGKY